MWTAPELRGAAAAPSTPRQRPPALSVLGELLVTAGCILLLFVGWQLWWTDLTAGRDAGRVTAGLEASWAADPVGNVKSDAAVPGRAFAVMQIPAFGKDWSWPVLEGTEHNTLTKGLGHYRNTALPGEIGNMAVAGHRTTYGRPMHNIDRLRAGDEIIITTRAKVYTYRVRDHLIVKPSQTEVADANPDHPGSPPTEALLTITSCHPAYSARERYVIQAVLESERARVG